LTGRGPRIGFAEPHAGWELSLRIEVTDVARSDAERCAEPRWAEREARIPRAGLEAARKRNIAIAMSAGEIFFNRVRTSTCCL
jgi:hypothetical protein